MEQSSKDIGIGIFGHYGNENLGDEAIIEAMVQNMRARWPSSRLYGFSINPRDTQQRYGIPAFPIRQVSEPISQAPIPSKPMHDGDSDQVAERSMQGPKPSWALRTKNMLKQIPVLGSFLKLVSSLPYLGSEFVSELRFLKQSYRHVQQVDVLLITGSNQFLDNFGGVWGFPYTLLKWSILAKLGGKKVFYISVGAGPLSSNWSKRLIRMALLFSDFTSFRDVPSKQLIQSAGFKGESYVFPDLAHSLSFQELSSANNIKCDDDGEKKPTVGINPMPMYDSRYWCEADDNKYLAYIKKLAEFSSILIHEGYPVRFFPTQPKDEHVIADVLDMLKKDNQIDTHGMMSTPRTVEELMNDLARVDIAITTRFHGTLLALHAGKPVLAICYYRKTDDLMKEMGQGDYSVELDDFGVSELLKKFRTIELKREKEVERIKIENRQRREALEEQYQMLFDMIEAC